MTTSHCRLPPDVREASWSWSWETVPWYGRGVSQGERYLTCRVLFQNVANFADLVVEAAAQRGAQTASATYTRPIERWDWTKDLVVGVETSLGDLQMRVVSAGLTPSGASQRITAWLHPHHVGTLVEALDDYVAKWRRGDYVDF